MAWAFGLEQQQFGQSVRAVLGRVADELETESPDAVREVWSRVNREVELSSLGIPESVGGYGSLLELGVAHYELGRVLQLVPWFPTLGLAARTLCSVKHVPQAANLLERIVDGHTAAMELVTEPTGIRAKLDRSGGSGNWILHGVSQAVLGAEQADFILFRAALRTGTGLFAVEGSDAGLTLVPLPAVDSSVAVARCELRGSEAVLLAQGDAATIASTRSMAEATVLLAAYQVGAAGFCLDQMSEHMLIREQFGRPLAELPVVRNLLADLVVTIESARAAAAYGLWSIGLEEGDVEEIADIVGIVCSRALVVAADRNAHIHGGIGFTWEHVAHRYRRHAIVAENLLLNRDLRLDRLRGRLFDRTR